MKLSSKEALERFSIENNNTIPKIVKSLITPGFTQNQMSLDEELGPKFHKLIEKALLSCVPMAMGRPDHDDVENCLASIREANDMVNKFACQRMVELTTMILSEGSDKYVTAVSFSDKRVQKIASEMGRTEEDALACFEVAGPLAKLLDYHASLLPNGAATLSAIQSALMAEDDAIQKLPMSDRVVVGAIGAMLKVRTQLMTEGSRVSFQVSTFTNAMQAVRDLATLLSLNVPDMAETLKSRLEAVSEYVSEEVEQMKKFVDQEPEDTEPDNVIHFPNSKTVH